MRAGSSLADIESALNAVDHVRDQMARGRGPSSHGGPVDPYDLREFRRDATKGQNEKGAEPWKQVMGAHGFRWYEPHELYAKYGPEIYLPAHLEGLVDHNGQQMLNPDLYQERMHLHGQFRREIGGRTVEAFTVLDLVSMFVTPAAFDAWFREHQVKKAAAAAGIRLPKPNPRTSPRRKPMGNIIVAQR